MSDEKSIYLTFMPFEGLFLRTYLLKSWNVSGIDAVDTQKFILDDIEILKIVNEDFLYKTYYEYLY